ncbi:MAG: glycoside hydrolase family 99-like domain-containing protein [Bacteroidales bacterium]|nr:glycosyl transferase [Bacteroidales bacterium]
MERLSPIKFIAFYLPQFHEIEENNRWWGPGFTEWTNTRRAQPIFKGHRQPRVPLNNNYYDLSVIEPLKHQAELARRYGIFGFCFYHYWFNGKLLLEKPAENLLQHKDIQINFCFSWANEPWTRTWSGKGNEVLMPQNYGDKDDWIRHFNYLLPFFQDERYIKVDGQPMFLIYKSKSIENCKEMMETWIELAKQHGMPGIHFVETLRDASPDSRMLPFSAKVEFEPARSFNNDYVSLNIKRIRRLVIRTLNKLFGTSIPYYAVIEFKNIANKSLRKISSKGTYGGVFVGWDNTPRRGIEGLVVTEATKEEFKNYLRQKIKIVRNIYQTSYIFVNAWNEWCEGAYLEPDTVNQYRYLEAIQEVLNENL